MRPLAYGLFIVGLAVLVSQLSLGDVLTPATIALKCMILLCATAGAVPVGILDARHVRGWTRAIGLRAG
jgi:hypothetical protein